MEKLIFPMNYINITQGENGSYSHQGTNAIDNAGKDTGIDPIFAPCTMRHVWRDKKENGNAVFFQSTQKVEFADGTVDYATLMFIHDNDISDYRLQQVFKQGEEFGDEGTAGRATGNHTHIEVAKGKFQRPYMLNRYNVYQLPNTCHVWDAFFIDERHIIINDMGYGFKKILSKKKEGWIWDERLKEQTYYENDIMQKNKWVQDIDGQWYWLKEDGRMARKEVVDVNGYQRCFWDSGACADRSNTYLNVDGTYQKKK